MIIFDKRGTGLSDRAAALITIGGFPRRIKGPDYPWGPDREQMYKSFDAMAAEWGGPVGMEARMPSVAADPIHRQWWSKFLRLSANPSAALALSKANAEIDIRRVLPSIRVPTLILHAVNDGLIPIEVGRYMASQIPNEKFVAIDSIDHVPFFHAADWCCEKCEVFCRTFPGLSYPTARLQH